MEDQGIPPAWVFGSLGLGFLGLGLWMLTRARAFAARAVRVQGVVTDLELFPHGMGKDAFIVVFRFTTYEGQEIEVRSSFAVEKPPARGELAPVVYDPRKPERARLDSPGQRGTRLVWIVILVGTSFATMGALFLLGILPQ